MELLIPLDVQSEYPLYEQIYYFMKEEIKKGSLKPMAKLPSTRYLAEHLKVSRSTAQMAYDQLVSEGYIEPIPCKGYYVSNIEELYETVPASPSLFALAETNEQERYEIDFSPRGIDLNSFPYHIWRRLSKNTLVDNKKEMFLAGQPQGEPALREAVRDYLHSARGVNCQAPHIIIGAGSEYLLMLLYQILGRDKTIAMENPTYKQAYRVFDSLGYQVEPIEMDQYGMDVQCLENGRAQIAYIMPSHQYPTGIVMPIKRRQELLAWALKEEGRYLIEDDYDSEFRYKGKPIPALQGMDTGERVIYLGTFSKSIAPAIRISFMVLPQPLLKIYQETYSFYASTVSRIDQNMVYQFLVEGYYERHLNRMRAVYRGKHDVLLAELRLLEPDFTISGEYAGLHVLLEHKRGICEEKLIEMAASNGVKVYGLSSYFIEGKEKRKSNTVILGYANLTEAKIQKGIRLLKQAW